MEVIFVLAKGKPWSVQQTRQLVELRNNGKTVPEIANLMGKSADAIKQKLRRLGLKVVTIKNFEGSTSTDEELIMPEEMPSIEEALLKLAAAMKVLENPKLSKTDVIRLKTLIHTCKIYQKLLAEYMDYRRVERKLIILDEKYAQLVKSMKAQDN